MPIAVNAPRWHAAALLLALLALIAPSDGFAAEGLSPRWLPRSKFGRPLKPTAASTQSAAAATAAAAAAAAAAEASVPSRLPPSWEDLASVLTRDAPPEEDESKPVLTLYRDTNGWCPFCERVWLCLEAKGLPYRERLISLSDKPEWYKELVPTTLVPAVLLHDDDRDDGEPAERGAPQRRLVWESLDVMRALDDAFPDTPRLVLDTPDYLAAREQMTALSSAGLAYVYSGRNGTLAAEEKAERKSAFESELDKLEESLASHGGPFRLGRDFTGADAEIVPLLERWRYQLPITSGVDITEGRPALKRWFDAMDSFAPYKNRVSGDEYSWAAVSSTFQRYFGEDDPKSQDAINMADAAAARLSESFADVGPGEDSAHAAREAAAKLISNHEAVVADCTRSEPASQKELDRAPDAGSADLVLRYVASALLSSDGAMAAARDGPLVDVPGDQKADAALAARTVARRLCVPRDMGAPAAKILRGVLAVVSERLENE